MNDPHTFSISMCCEYGGHGKHGAKNEPAYVFVESKCPHCDDKARSFWVCWPCYGTDRELMCGRCKKDAHPSEAWTALVRW